MKQQIIILILLTTILLSCKAKQKTIETPPPPVVNTTVNEPTTTIINNHNAIISNFKTAVIKADVNYITAKEDINLNAEIKIKNNEAILITLKMFGITGAKALITPKEVKYYDKISGKFFEGDYQTLSNWLGTSLDYAKVQNILLGRAIDNLTLNTYTLTTQENTPKLERTTTDSITTSFLFDPDLFILKKQEINQNTPPRNLSINYSNTQTFLECMIPMDLSISATQKSKNTIINIHNKHITFNEKVNFPYNVPNGYEQITIK